MLGLRSSPKDDFCSWGRFWFSSISTSLPREFLEHSEIPSEIFLRQVEQAVTGFSGPPQHNVAPQPQPQPLAQALLDAEFVFDQDDTSKHPLSPLYRGPYRVLRRLENYLFSRSRINPTLFLWTDWSLWFQLFLWPCCTSSLRSASSGAGHSSQTSGFWSSSSEESEVFSGSSYEASPESSQDSLRFAAFLRHSPASPSGGSNLWLLRRPSSTSCLQSDEKPQRQRAQLISSTWLETRSISFSSIKLLFIHYTVNIDHSILSLCCYYTRAKPYIINEK